jgi:hypothetical protein
MSLVFGDYVSGYLALLYGVDPTPTTIIDESRPGWPHRSSPVPTTILLNGTLIDGTGATQSRAPP